MDKSEKNFLTLPQYDPLPVVHSHILTLSGSLYSYLRLRSLFFFDVAPILLHQKSKNLLLQMSFLVYLLSRYKSARRYYNILHHHNTQIEKEEKQNIEQIEHIENS